MRAFDNFIGNPPLVSLPFLWLIQHGIKQFTCKLLWQNREMQCTRRVLCYWCRRWQGKGWKTRWCRRCIRGRLAQDGHRIDRTWRHSGWRVWFDYRCGRYRWISTRRDFLCRRIEPAIETAMISFLSWPLRLQNLYCGFNITLTLYESIQDDILCILR